MLFRSVGGSLFFNGSNYANVVAGTTALAFGTGDFTIECWVYPTTAGVIYDQRTGTADISPLINAASGSWTYQYGGTTAITGGAVTLNAWTHVAVSRASGSTKLWINGTQSGVTYTDTNNYTCPSGRPYLGAYGDTAGAKLTGYITNLRAVKGTAVYTTTFTPSTSPLTAIANTQLLLGAATQATYLVDSSTNNFTTTPQTTITWNSLTPFTVPGATGSGLIIAGTVSAVANVIAGNVTTAGLMSATGNITGGNILGGANVNATTHTGTTVSVTGNITGGNILGGANVNATTHTGTTVSVTGNVNGGNVIATTLVQGTTLSASGNVIGGNVTTAGLISATGNVTGGNLVSAVHTSAGNLTLTSTAANAWIFLTPTGTGTIQINKDITNGQANGVGNIGNSTGYFNTVFAKATSAQYADLAETYAADRVIPPGTVVSFGGTHEVTISCTSGDTRIAGVVSTNPSYVMNAGLVADYPVVVALTGRVPTSVTGNVSKGDMMVSAGDGTARASATPAMGSVLGKALEDFTGESGVIEIVVGRM